MRTLKFLLQKEFLQIFRAKLVLRLILLSPAIQLLILPLAANYEIKNINISFVDHDLSSYSQKLRLKILSSGYFKLTSDVASYREAFHLIENDETDVIVEIPERFEEDLIRGGTQKILIAVDAINGIKAGLGSAYLASIVGDFNNDIQLQWKQPGRILSVPSIDIATSFWYNPLMIYFILMVPGILVNLLTSIGGMTSSLNIVKEKEMGTIEQINVTPIKKYHFILGKLIPFAILGLAVFTTGLLIGRFVYGIVPVGNILLLYIFAIDYMFALLGFGLLISTYCNTQQQAISLIFFFIMIFNLMSGLFTPVDSMPEWARTIAHCIPTTYFIEVMRMIVIKGSSIRDVWYQFCAILFIGIILNTWAVVNYKKTS